MNKRVRPAEWETHSATWLIFPHQKQDWPGKFSTIAWVYAEIIKKISESEKIFLIVQDIRMQKQVRTILEKNACYLKNIEFLKKETDRTWARDTGPIFVRNNDQLEIIDFNFNAWAKYPNYKLDTKIPSWVSKKNKISYTQALYQNKKVVLEGGAIDSNGAGILLTTEECLLDKKIQVRNPGFTKKDYEKVFSEFLGISKVVWLGKGISGDDTHGHVDDLCRFVNKDTVVLCREKNPKDENYNALEENWERLQSEKLEVIELPMPSPIVFEGVRLPASYANFYIANDVVIVPTFNDVQDKTALGILSEVFKDRKVIGIHSVDLVWGLGTLHCLSQEQTTFSEL